MVSCSWKIQTFPRCPPVREMSHEEDGDVRLVDLIKQGPEANGWMALHWKCSKRHLVSFSTEFDETEGYTMLHDACIRNHRECTRLLAKAHETVDQRDDNGWTPLHAACYQGHVTCVRILIRHNASIDNKTSFNENVTCTEISMQSDSYTGHKTCVQQMMSKGDTSTRYIYHASTPLHCACMNGHQSCAQLLLNAGADVNKVNKFGFTPLHYACMHGHAACVRVLVENGADVDKANDYSDTPLHLACWQGWDMCTQLVVNAGADIDKTDIYGWTPLMNAHENNYGACARKLLSSNAKEEEIELQSCSMDTAAAIGRNAFLRKVVVTDSPLEKKHLVLVWTSPSLELVKDSEHTYSRPRELAAGWFVEGEVVHVLDEPGRWVVNTASSHCVDVLRNYQKEDKVLNRIPFKQMTAVNPGWHEIDLAIKRGVRNSATIALDPRYVGWFLRKKIDEYVG